MPHWQVRLKGNKHELEILARLFASPGLKVIRDADEYFLTCEELESFEDARDVLSCALEKVRLLNGAAKIEYRDFQSVEVQGVTRLEDDRPRTQFIHPSAIVVERDSLSVADALASGDPPIDPQLQRALRFLGSGPDNWPNLYNVYEVIREDVRGDRAIAARGWATDGEIVRFRQTANSVQAVGDHARHGKSTIPAPRNPMSLEQARTFVRSLLKKWIRAKGLKQPKPP